MDFHRIARSLVVRVVIVAILVTISGTALRFSLLTNTLHERIGDLVSAHLLSEATYVASDIDEKIIIRKQLLETMARQLPIPLLDKPRELTDWLAERHTLAPSFSLGIAVLPLSGQGVIADYPSLDARRKIDYSADRWFLEARDQQKFAIGKAMIGRASGQGIITMAAPVLDARGQVAAVIYGITPLEAEGFLNLIQKNAIGHSGGFLLISPRDQIFIAASTPEMRLQATPPPGASLLYDKAMAGWRGTGLTTNAFGVEELLAVVSVPSANWFVVARMATSEAFLPVAKSHDLLLKQGIWISLCVLLAFAAFLTYIFRPLRRASRLIHAMADGRMPLAPLPSTGHDEVGDMVDGFNFLVAQVRENERRMTQLAHQDVLTGLPNRLSFLLQAQQSIALAKRQKGKLALMFIDLDGFKPVNDRFGHDTGDQLLQEIAKRLSTAVRATDIVARFGGDEFVVLLADIHEQAAIALLAEKIIARISAAYRLNGTDFSIGASIGVAFLPEDSEDIESLIGQADTAMYEAKRAGRNCCRFADIAG